MEKKILMLGWGFPPNIDGGLDIHVAHLFQELRELDVEVTLALPEDRAPNIPDVVGIETDADGMIPCARDMSREVVTMAEDYDIIHTHDWFGAESGLKAMKYSGVRWVSTLHSLSSSRSRSTNREIEQMERAAVERSDELIAVSRKLGDAVFNEYGREPRVIHNGFSQPSSTGKNVKEELGIDGKMVFFVGRHAEQKGIEHLLYGFSKFLNAGDATLVIGGEGHMTPALEDFVEILGIGDRVKFPGFIPDEELGDYYSAADVFVSPSIDEPFGLTLTEALESGTPVVATENGAEEVLPQDSFVKVRPDSDSIKTGLEKAMEVEIPEFESRSWEAVARETMEIYRSLS
ncbi:MAG: glycosyltransferase family 4 protein [Candidatus Nanohaloarchaea archaeon]